MKTKKILAIMTLVAFMVSILPMAAFANTYTTFGSSVSVEEGSADVVATPTNTPTDDYLEYEVTLVSTSATFTDNLYVATNRGSGTDYIFYKAGTMTDYVAINHGEAAVLGELNSPASVMVRIQSKIAGNVKVAFGNHQEVTRYALGQSFNDGSMANIIGQKLYDGLFNPASVATVELATPTSVAAANGVTAQEVTVFVKDASNMPIAGEKVSLSISGTAAKLSVTEVTTKANGKADFKVTATKPGVYTITAKAGSKEGKGTVEFSSTGVVDIKAESDNNQKIAIADTTKMKEFKYSLYDAAGNKVTFASGTDMSTVTDLKDIAVDVITEPSKSDLNLKKSDLSINSDGLLALNIDTSKLKEGNYEVRVYLLNGKQVTYAFSAKEQGDITSLVIEYDATTYAADSLTDAPTVKHADAEGYTTEASTNYIQTNIKFSSSDATYVASWSDLGAMQLEDKLGSFVVTAVDTKEGLVATYNITVGKAASSLKLSAPSYTAVGETAKVSIQLVDGDGKAVAPGVAASTSDAFVLSRPTGAIVGDLDVDHDDFAKGKASVDVTSNVAGNVVLQVVITDVAGKSYTGSVTVGFGEAAAARKSLIMFIGSTNYMVGNAPAITDAAPFIKDGRTYVAVRPIGDALGSTIYWDAATQTVTLVKPGETVTIVIGSSVIKVDRAGVVTEYPTDAPAHIKDGRTYLPFRAIGEAMGYTVTWDAATQAVIFS